MQTAKDHHYRRWELAVLQPLALHTAGFEPIVYEQQLRGGRLVLHFGQMPHILKNLGLLSDAIRVGYQRQTTNSIQSGKKLVNVPVDGFELPLLASMG